MLWARLLAPVPKAGKSLGQVVTIFHLKCCWDWTAGAACCCWLSPQAAKVPAASSGALCRKERRERGAESCIGNLSFC